MNNFTIKLDLEPSDNYEKAKKSLSIALNDFSKLDEQQQFHLLNEFVSADILIAICNKMQNIYNK